MTQNWIETVKFNGWGANRQFLPSLGGKLTQIQVRGVNRQFLPSLGGKLTQMQVRSAN